jgi:hypothetical protein
VFRRYLLWLLEGDPSTLSGAQQKFHSELLNLPESILKATEGP